MPIPTLVLGLLLSMQAPAPAPPAPPSPPSSPGAVVAPAPPAPPTPPAAPAAVWATRHGAPRARLGAQVSTMTPELRGFFGASEDAGLLVQRIEPGSAAEAAKVEVGDVLVEVDGHRIAQVSDVRDALTGRSTGDVVDVVVVHKKRRKTLKATLAATEAGPTVMALPPMPELELQLPPEALRFLSPEQRAEIERELEQAREELREAQRQLEAMETPGAAAPTRAPRPPKASRPPVAPPEAPKGKRGKARRGR